MSSFVPSAITQPFFELQTPDFAWKFVWTVETNYKKYKKVHKYKSKWSEKRVFMGLGPTKVLITQSFFELKFICRYGLSNQMRKYKSTKVQKYKSTKVQTYKSTEK